MISQGYDVYHVKTTLTYYKKPSHFNTLSTLIVWTATDDFANFVFMDVKEHYKNHLSRFYTWMFGSYDQSIQRQLDFFKQHGVQPTSTRQALDLGCGSGFQSLALRQLGFDVHAIDFSESLLQELKSKDPTVQIHLGDLRHLQSVENLKPELIVCMGDTLSHLNSWDEIKKLISDCAKLLTSNGQLILTFRNLTIPPKETDRFFIIQSDQDQILTCFLEDKGEKVSVNDLLHKRVDHTWTLHKSSYLKLKIDPAQLEKLMLDQGFRVQMSQLASGLDVIKGLKI